MPINAGKYLLLHKFRKSFIPLFPDSSIPDLYSGSIFTRSGNSEIAPPHCTQLTP